MPLFVGPVTIAGAFRRLLEVIVSTVGDVLKDNSLYEKGVFLDSNYYKRHIPQERFQDAAPSVQEFREAEIRETLLTMFKEISSIALISVPSFYTLGSNAGATIVLAGAAVLLGFAFNKNIDLGDFGWIRGTELRGQLFALLPQKERDQYLLREVLISLVFKVSFAVTVVFGSGAVTSMCASLAVFYTVVETTLQVADVVIFDVRRQIKEIQQRLNASSALAT